MSADLVIVLLPSGMKSSGRGTHAELGIALGLNIPILIWSNVPGMFEATEATCAFYHHPGVVAMVGDDAVYAVLTAPVSLLDKKLNVS